MRFFQVGCFRDAFNNEYTAEAELETMKPADTGSVQPDVSISVMGDARSGDGDTGAGTPSPPPVTPRAASGAIPRVSMSQDPNFCYFYQCECFYHFSFLFL